MHIAESIWDWLGWCPNKGAVPYSPVFRHSDPVVPAMSCDRQYLSRGVILDSGSTGISVQLFAIILGVTLAGLFAIMYYGYPTILSSLGLLVISLFILGSAAGTVIHDGRTTTVECTREAIVFRRPFFGPVILEKGEVETIGIRDNIHYSYRLLIRASTVFLAATFIAALLPLLTGYPSLLTVPASSLVFYVYLLSALLYAVLLFFRSTLRSRYPRVLALQTKNQKIFGLYLADPGMMKDLLSRWHAEGGT